MSITQEIDQVMLDLQKGVDANGNVDLPVLLSEVVTLFNHLKSVLPKTNPKERSDIVAKITQLHAFLMKESKRLSAQTGISQEQMLRFAENPNNFTKEQWSLLENIKNVMGIQTQEIKNVMQKFAPQSLAEVKSSGKPRGKRKSRDIKKA